MNATDFLNASSDSPQSTPLGKVTTYGYANDDYGDSLTRAGMGAFENQLRPTSLAVSPDIEKRFKALGILPGEKVKLTLADGTQVVRTYDDHTATDEQAAKLGLAPLRGRFDFYDPTGRNPNDSAAVIRVDTIPRASDFLNETTIEATPSIGGELAKGNIRNAAGIALENVREFASPIFGPTVKQQIENAVPVKQPDGTVKYEYMPDADAITKRGLVPALTGFALAATSPQQLVRAINIDRRGEKVNFDTLAAEQQKSYIPATPEPNPQGMTAAQYLAAPGDSKGMAIAKGAFNATQGLLEGVTNPAFLAMPESRLVSGAFAADMLSQVPGEVQTALDPNAPLQSRVESGIGGVVNTALSGMAGLHAKTLNDRLNDAARMAEPAPPQTADEFLNETPASDAMQSRMAAPPEAEQPPVESAPAPEPTQWTGLTESLNDQRPIGLPNAEPAAPVDVVDAPSTFRIRPSFDSFGTESTPVASALINDLGGVLSKSQADRSGEYERNAELWDDAPTFAHLTHNKVYNPNGVMPDVAAQGLYDAGLIPEPTPLEMWKALKRESDTTRAIAAAPESQGEQLSNMAEAFAKAATKPTKNNDPVAVRDLQIGDSVKVGTEEMKVTGIAPETFDVTLEDGHKYGVQLVHDGEVIYGQHKPVERSAADPFAETTPQTAAEFLNAPLEKPFALQSATEQQLRDEAAASEQRQAIAEGRNTPLQGTAGDLTADMFGEGETPLFNERRDNLAAEPQTHFDQPVPEENRASQPSSGAQADRGSPYATVPLAGLNTIKIADMPELVNIARELSGNVPAIKRMGEKRGYAKGVEIALNSENFSDPVSAAKTLAHEIGHVADYLPEGTMKRGNALGRLISSVTSYLRHKAPLDPSGIGGNATLKAVRGELLALTDWWKPYKAAATAGKLPESYVKYRESSPELYADAISVLFNSPKDLQQRAPTFWKMFFNYLNKKPPVKAAFFDAWDRLNLPEAVRLEQRQQAVRKMFADGSELMNRKIEQREQRGTLKSFVNELRTGLDTIYWPAIARERESAKAGNPTAQQHVVEWFFDAHPLHDNDVYLWLNHVNEGVIKPMQERGLTPDDLGEYLLWDRVANERYDVTKMVNGKLETTVGGRSVLANPRGHTPETARKQLMQLERKVGAPAFAVLQNAAAKFRDQFYAIAEQMHTEGMITKDAWDIVQQNRDHYAAFVPLEYADLHVPSGIKKQLGTFKDVTNPYIATVLKGITAIRALEFQRAKSHVSDFLKTQFPGEIEPAKTQWDGKRNSPIEPRDKDKALLKVMENGTMKGYYVPREIGAMLETMDSGLTGLSKLLSPLDWLWHKVFYPTFITYNPLFQYIRNPVRDIERTALALPNGVGMQEAIAQRWRVREIVKNFVKDGTLSPEIADGLEARAFTPPQGTWQATATGEDQFMTIARRFGLLPPQAESWIAKNRFTSWAYQLGEKIETAGRIRELTPKVGAYTHLVKEMGWDPQEASYYVRNNIGTPNYLKRGKYTRIANTVFPFTNVWMKGWQSSKRMMMNGFDGGRSGNAKKSVASWWVRWAFTGGALAIAKAAAASGLFGDDLKKLYARVGSYWMQNYDVLPIGTTGGGTVDGEKTAFIALPKDPTERIVSGLTYTLARAIFETAQGHAQNLSKIAPQSLSLASSDMPGLNPTLKIASTWADYLRGVNPYDSFRNTQILSDQQMAAGMPYTLSPMLAWTYSQTGLQNFVQINPHAGSTTEITLGMLPAINGLVKISDTGLRETIKQDQQQEAGARARISLDVPGNAASLRTEFNYLKALGSDHRTPIMQTRYEQLLEWNREIYQPYLSGIEQNPGETKAYKQRLQSYSQPYERK